jgi:hypothetical protein
MNKFTEWMMSLRPGHQYGGAGLRNGYLAQQDRISAGNPFIPDIGREIRLQRLRNEVATLGAESFDEATDSPFDERITEEGREWDSRLEQQHAEWLARASERLDRAETTQLKFQQLLDRDRLRLEHAETAVETGVLSLTGREPDPAGRPAQVIRIVPENPSATHSQEAPPGEETTEAPGEVAEPGQDWQAQRKGALVPVSSRVSRTELRQLLEPQDANRVPRWAEPGFQDGTLLAGRPRSTYIHVLALLLAAGADIGAFTQTVELVLPQSDLVVGVVVTGLTAVVLYIAHMVGVMLREATASSKMRRARPQGLATSLRGVGIFICTAIWLAVGLLAFWVRYTVPLIGTTQIGSGGIGGGGIGGGGIGGGGIGGGSVGGAAANGATTGDKPLQAAAIFLGLYLATGVVAIVGAYFTHNPYRSGYAAAIRAYRKASKRMSASIERFGLAFAAYQGRQAEIKAAEQILSQAKTQNGAFTTQLKQTARIEIAGLAKDPAVTDAYFKPGP